MVARSVCSVKVCLPSSCEAHMAARKGANGVLCPLSIRTWSLSAVLELFSGRHEQKTGRARAGSSRALIPTPWLTSHG